jgi:hypothetical protein
VSLSINIRWLEAIQQVKMIHTRVEQVLGVLFIVFISPSRSGAQLSIKEVQLFPSPFGHAMTIQVNSN